MKIFSKSSLIVVGVTALFICSCSNRSNQNTANQSYENTNQQFEVIDPEQESDDIYSVSEPQIIASPESKQQYLFPESEKITGFDVSLVRPEVAIITEQNGKSYIKTWKIGSSELSTIYMLPSENIVQNIVWHPVKDILFVTTKTPNDYQILRIEPKDGQWVCNSIFSSVNTLQRLVINPRPFGIYENNGYVKFYRLYAGMDNGDGTYRVVTITEFGKRLYQVIGPEATKTTYKDMDADMDPSDIIARWALPVAFHPAGHQLIWEDKDNKYFAAEYWSEAWGESHAMKLPKKLNGIISPTPNGLELIHWNSGQPGIGLYFIPTGEEETRIPDYRFVSAPLPVTDGKGIVGITVSNKRQILNYVPIAMPLHDVVNAWMFVSSKEETNLLRQHYGLFRSNQSDQLYKLYETENYYQHYMLSRPYLVTTDIMWEIFGTAYQGIFIIKEKEEAIPNFWQFIDEADKYLAKSNTSSAWKPVFIAIKELRVSNKLNPEVARILDEEDSFTELINDKYRYSDLKPRGHYTSSPEMENYFRAFRYFTTIYQNKQDTLQELNSFPEEIKKYAVQWIESYTGMIAPSRAPMIWKGLKQTVPAYCQYPQKEARIFPLSWGFDNEVLYSTVFHENFPVDLQIISKQGQRRVFSSGIDLASAMGNGFAENMMKQDYEQYPNLRKVIGRLKKNFKDSQGNAENIYDRWLDAMATQWMDTVHSRSQDKDRNIWQVKRLQTGLATWATLRHATILVNERSAAESGEAGFETLFVRQPRGSVEPDPYTFAAIAGLFDHTTQYVSGMRSGKRETPEQKSLYDGIIKRLGEAASEIRTFQQMAEKESKGITLTGEEHQKIRSIANIAEHLFLIFSSLGNEEYAISDPDPMPKIADVAGDRDSNDYLMVAVGNTMEWNHIVPFYGRRQIVKGAIYSYYEFVSDKFLNDEEWREQVTKQDFLPWIKPYITSKQTPGLSDMCY